MILEAEAKSWTDRHPLIIPTSILKQSEANAFGAARAQFAIRDP